MTKQLIPAEALKKHIAILGMNGSGKTSVAKSQIIEPALAAGDRVCNIDPTGVGWGLRLMASGKPGYQIYIVGGERADFPLHRRDGKAWGEIVGTSSDSFVFDTSQMTVEDRSQWFTDFAETLLRKNKGPLSFVLDEAHLFAPQGGSKSGGVAPRMLHATNNLLALGRSRGLRITMISQRPAKLHKDSLTQAHSLIAMMMTSPQDRNAVKDWIADQADSETGKDIIASLPTLAPGEGWLWAPRERVLDRIKFPRPKTFDSSSAPDASDGDGPKLATLDPAAITAKLEKVAKETASNDPAKLRAEIAALRKELAAKPSAALPDQEALAIARDDAYGKGRADGYNDCYTAFARIIKYVVDRSREFPAILNDIARDMIEAEDQRVKPSKESVSPAAKQTPVGAPVMRSEKPLSAASGSGSLSKPEQKIVDAIQWWNCLGVQGPSHPQVAFVAGYSHRSGTWSTYLSRLRSAGMIEGRGDLVLTAAGLAASNYPSTPPSGDALRDTVLDKIDGPLRKILTPIMAAYPNARPHADVADEAGYSSKSGTWSTYLSKLRSLDLIEGRGDLKAQGWLFP